LLFALCFVAGAVAVGHELLWSRRMLGLLGGSSDSATVAFGAFVLGLAVGAGMAARAIRARPHAALLLDAAACQVWFAFLAIPVLLTIPLSDLLWPRLGAAALTHPLGLVVRVLLATALLLLPAIASGAFLPFLLAARCDASRPHARLGPLCYGINTLGGLAAVALLPLLLEPLLGLMGCSIGLIVVNLLLAAGCLVLRRRLPRPAVSPADTRSSEPCPESCWRPILALPRRALPLLWRKPPGPVPAPRLSLSRHLLPAFGIGALVLAAEMLVYHHAAQVAANSLHVTAMVLGAVLLGLAGGSLLAGKVRSSPQALPALLLATTLLFAVQPVLFCSLTGGLRPFPLHAGSLAYLGHALRLAALGILPLFVVAGTLFPLLFSTTSAELTDERGQNWGILLLVNGVGCFAGAVLSQYALMPLFGPWLGMGVLAAMSAIVLAVFLGRHRRWIWLGTSFVLALYAVPWGSYDRLPLWSPPDPGLRADRVLCGRDGIAVLLEAPNGGRRILLNNSYGIGGSHSARLDHMETLLPMALHPAPHRVAAIGVGAGFTAEAALQDPQLDHLDAVEISPLVLELARTGFPTTRGGLFTDPRSRVHLTDGRIFLATQRDRYDVIVGDLFVPWREGLGGLYSLEFCHSARGALRPGGLYCQWIPLYQVSRQELELIVRTFRAVFPQAWVVRNSFSFRHPAIGLVGWKGSQGPSPETIAQRCAALRRAPALRNAFLLHPAAVLMHLIAPAHALAPASETGPVNTLANIRLGYLATTGVLDPDWQPLTLDRWRSLLAEVIAATSDQPELPSRQGLRAAQHWLDAQSAALAKRPDEVHASVAAALRAMPTELLDDPAFTWADFLVDVPLPIPRNYREVHGTPPPGP
jgi:spermidine synthase